MYMYVKIQTIIRFTLVFARREQSTAEESRAEAACFGALKRMSKRPCPLHSIAGVVPFRDCRVVNEPAKRSAFRIRSARVIIAGQVRFPVARLFTKIRRETSRAREISRRVVRETRHPATRESTCECENAPRTLPYALFYNITQSCSGETLLLRSDYNPYPTHRESFHGLSFGT